MSRNTKQQNLIAMVYDKRGKLLAMGQNSYTRTHTLQAKYAEKSGNPEKIYIHAEIDALIKAQRRGKMHKMVIMRMGRSGRYLNAKPCESCQLAIEDFGIKIIEHT